MKLKTYFLPGVFSLEFLIRPENLAVGGGGRRSWGEASAEILMKLLVRGANPGDYLPFIDVKHFLPLYK